jgi:hypothetical protein
VENCSERAWENISIESLPRYIHVRRFEKESESLDTLPRQTWVAHFEIDATGLPVGTHQGVITLRTSDGTNSRQIPIVAHITDDISLAPSVINFGKIRAGECSEARIMVSVKGAHKRSFAPSMICIQPEPMGDMTFDWQQQSEDTWVLKLKYKATTDNGIINGNLTFRFPDGITPRMVKYAAWVQKDQGHAPRGG